jgi:ABC-type uncharacterized transport system substrate-binding protein
MMHPTRAGRSAPFLHHVRACAAVAALLVSCRAAAHPHVWIDYTATAQMNGSKIVAIREEWVFTKKFPFSIVGDFSDAPTSGPMDPKHTALIYKQAFSSLKAANYFTHVYAGGKAVETGEARDFAVAIENKNMVYRFLVPLSKPVDVAAGGASKVVVGVWDDSFFVDFASKGGKPVQFGGNGAQACTAENFQDRDHPIFGGMVIPTASKLSC